MYISILTTKAQKIHPLLDLGFAITFGQVGSLEQNLRQGAEHVTDVEGAVVTIGKQLANVKQAPEFGARS